MLPTLLPDLGVGHNIAICCLKCPGPWQGILDHVTIYACSKRVAVNVDQHCKVQDPCWYVY